MITENTQDQGVAQLTTKLTGKPTVNQVISVLNNSLCNMEGCEECYHIKAAIEYLEDYKNFLAAVSH